ncbi:MAG TPA: amidohydrolase family protein [candidate division Zixibacteria bacterium]|nr:amidohydrolase family protein [candidate division Zixibacteria bacterium]
MIEPAAGPPPASLPAAPPFTLRARLLTPLRSGGLRWEPDAAIHVDERGLLKRIGPGADVEDAVDIRPLVVMPGLVDLHAHLPQLPNAGVGAGLHLLEWLERYIFPLEREFDRAVAEVVAPAAFRAFARAGTTTVVAYGAIWPDSLHACFEAAEAHGIRAVIGKVMMDRLSYDVERQPEEVLELSVRQSAELCETWHGRDGGRLAYAWTPRFALSCSAEMLAESARRAREAGAYWQTHLAEDRGEVEEVRRLFPEARDYLDAYDRAGGVGPGSVFAHAIHLSDREVARLAESGAVVAHCPASNLFLASGAMPLARYLAAGVKVGLGSDVGAGPDVSLFNVMRAGAYLQNGLRGMGLADTPAVAPAEWLRLATLGGAEGLGLDDRIGSVEEGKEADLIAVDSALTAPLNGVQSGNRDAPEEILSRLIYRSHPDMVRAAWVRGRLLPA